MYVADVNNYREKQSKYNTKLGKLNEEDIKKLKKKLGSLEKLMGVCSLTNSSKFPFSHDFNALGISLASSWIIDSRVIDHMTHSLKKFSTYIPCPSNKKITIADGSLVTIVGQGVVNVNPSLSLNNVLHVPKLGHAKTTLIQVVAMLSMGINYLSLFCSSSFLQIKNKFGFITFDLASLHLIYLRSCSL